jgi:predicted RNA-binding Zn-ribbon protein involved in translation (DUF1610 family)
LENKPKVLVWDLETGFNKAAIFSIFNKYLPFSAITQERYIICGTLKELGKDSIYCISLLEDMDRFEEDPSDDKYVVTVLHKELSKADALIAHYGDAYDIKFFNTRAVYHGLPPLHNVVTIDTKKVAKEKFLFNSNRLDYLGKFLGCGSKIKTGEQLWHDCLNGSVEAVQKMLDYNIQDVLLLECVYNKLAPYVTSRINFNIFDRASCPSCGSKDIVRKGFVYTRVNRYQGYKCKGCGHRFRSGRAEKDFSSAALR